RSQNDICGAAPRHHLRRGEGSTLRRLAPLRVGEPAGLSGVMRVTGRSWRPCYPGAVAQQGRVAGVGTMANDPYARIAELEPGLVAAQAREASAGAEARRGQQRETALTTRLADALAHQAATAEVLRIIATPDYDARETLVALQQRARTLLDAAGATI